MVWTRRPAKINASRFYCKSAPLAIDEFLVSQPAPMIAHSCFIISTKPDGLRTIEGMVVQVE
jgi:hypothetical protein